LMKHTLLFFSFFLTGFATGCNKSSSSGSAMTDTPPATPTTQPADSPPPPPTNIIVITPPPDATPPPAPAVVQPAASSSTPAPQPSASSDTTGGNPLVLVVSQDATQPLPEVKDYSYAQKDDYFKAMQTELDELNQTLAQLSAKIQRGSDATKAAAQPKLDSVQLQINQLSDALDSAKSATESIWGDAKASVQRANDNALETLHNVSQWVDQQPSS
jgi:hypothetical protein